MMISNFEIYISRRETFRLSIIYRQVSMLAYSFDTQSNTIIKEKV